MSQTTDELICMKCGGSVRTYERNGIIIDQCERCHGIFLDRGELERLISAESSYLDDSEGGGFLSSGGKHRGKQQKRKSRGFLGELFDS